jgi:SAM-dependent methyltransferase
MDADGGLSMYAELADWFHLLTSPAEYADEAAFILATLRQRVDGPLESMLELGSGGGNTASHLKASVRMTLTDIADPMLELSRRLNPECEHVRGDMRTLRLGRTFDAVLLHDAVMYMTSPADLEAALATLAAHLRPGGAGMVLPDVLRETFVAETEHGGHDGDDRSLRFLSWTYDPDPDDSTFVTDFAMLLREGADEVAVRYDRHVLGLFAESEWVDALSHLGLLMEVLEDPFGRRVFVAVSPP